MRHVDAGLAQQIYTVQQTVLLAIDHTLDACLYDEFRAFDARRRGDVECRAVAAVVGARHFGYGVGLGVQNVWEGTVVLVLAVVVES